MPSVTFCILRHLDEIKNIWIARAICSAALFQGFMSQQDKQGYAQEEHWSEVKNQNCCNKAIHSNAHSG